MEIIGISCSPREKGNTETLMEQALEGARQEGAKASFLSLKGMTIAPCDACYACTKKGKCHIVDDMKLIYEAMERADGIIIGSPIYFWSLCGQAKVMIDRTFALRFPTLHLSNKVGGIILTATRRGCMSASGVLTYWMISNHMITADIVDGYASLKGAVKKDAHAMKASFELGRLMVQLVEKRFNYPEEFQHPIYQHVQVKHGIENCPIP